MKKTLALLSLLALCWVGTAVAQDNHRHHGHIKRVLLISVDGMHAVDFLNCANGISTVNNGDALLPSACRPRQDRHQLRRRQHLKTLGFLPRPDCDRHRRKPGRDRRLLRRRVFPELRRLRRKPPATALRAAPALAYAPPTGTTTEYEEGIDIDQTKVNGGAPGAALTDGGIAFHRPHETGPRPK